MKIASFFWILALGIAVLNAQTGQKSVDPATQLTYYTEDYPPANYTEKGQLTGASVELLKAIWNRMGVPEQPILLVPWARGYAEAQHSPGSVLFTMSRNAEREKLFRWVGPVFVSRHILIARKNDLPRIDSLGDAKGYLTAVIHQDISELSMREAGFPPGQLVIVTDLTQAMELLKNKRVQFACVSQTSLREWNKHHAERNGEIVEALTVNEILNYYAFHPATDTLLIQRFQRSLNSVSTQHKTILKKYGLTL